MFFRSHLTNVKAGHRLHTLWARLRGQQAAAEPTRTTLEHMFQQSPLLWRLPAPRFLETVLEETELTLTEEQIRAMTIALEHIPQERRTAFGRLRRTLGSVRRFLKEGVRSLPGRLPPEPAWIDDFSRAEAEFRNHLTTIALEHGGKEAPDKLRWILEGLAEHGALMFREDQSHPMPGGGVQELWACALTAPAAGPEHWRIGLDRVFERGLGKDIGSAWEKLCRHEPFRENPEMMAEIEKRAQDRRHAPLVTALLEQDEHTDQERWFRVLSRCHPRRALEWVRQHVRDRDWLTPEHLMGLLEHSETEIRQEALLVAGQLESTAPKPSPHSSKPPTDPVSSSLDRSRLKPKDRSQRGPPRSR